MALELQGMLQCSGSSVQLRAGPNRVPCRPVCSNDWPRPGVGYKIAREGGARRARACSASALRSTAAFGTPLPAANPERPRAFAGPHIHATLARRGNRIVISAVLAGVEGSVSVDSLMSTRIKGEKNLVVGKLDNGLQYVILPNKLPPERFEAHLEVHAGSVDELPTEQGIAHLVEHVTFLGSKRRENLLGTGARANAYTDFHHTVFHVHAPIINTVTRAPMLPQVLEALEEIAFKPEFLAARIEKERKAVMAEAQMMNTIEYRVDCQLLHHLHFENNLGTRFPIGKMDQVQSWTHAQLRAFWSKWYYPANTTLYVVGDLDRDIQATKQLIQNVFGKLPAPTMTAAEAQKLRQLYLDSQRDLHGPAYVAQPPAFSLLPPHVAAAAAASSTTLPSPGAVNPAAATPAAPSPSHANGNGAGHSHAPASASTAAHAGASPAHHSHADGHAAPVPPATTTVQQPPFNTHIDLAAVEGAGQLLVKERHPIRPPVAHHFGVGPIQDGELCPAPVRVFRHPLLQHFSLTVFCKLPVKSMKEISDLKIMLTTRILLSVFTYRVRQRYVAADPPFVAIELDISDSGREGCAVSTLAIKSEPGDWRGAVQVAVEELRRLQRHGITKSEFSMYLTAILDDSEQLARQANKIPSLDTLNFVMESLANSHTVMAHEDAHEAMVDVAGRITLEEVQQVARTVLTFGSDYGNESGPLADWAQHPERYMAAGPVRATSIIACLPAYTQESGESISMLGAAGSRKAPMGAAGHIDADEVDFEALEAQSKQLDEVDIPEGAIKFDLSPAEIAQALSDLSREVAPPPEVECPKRLIPPEVMDAKVAALQPHFVPLGGAGAPGPAMPPADAFSGVVQRQLQNGVRVNYRVTDNEPNAALMRLIVPGGRAAEQMATGPDGFGAVLVGARTLNEVGSMGSWSREEVEVFCIANMVNAMLDADEENIIKDYHVVLKRDSFMAAFELLHLFMTEPVWAEEAMKRAKTAWVSNVRGVDKSLERGTSERIMACMLGTPEQRKFRDPTEEEIEALTLDGIRARVQGLLHAGAVELNVVGDFEPAKLEALLLRFVGTIPPADPAAITPIEHTTVTFMDPPFEERHSAWHLNDSDERACAFIAGPAPARWGPFGSTAPLEPLQGEPVPPTPVLRPGASTAERKAAEDSRRQHPLFSSCVLMLLTEVINSRLFTTVRDSLGLTYDVSFEFSMFDRVRAGWFSVRVTSHPNKIYDALDASVAVLKDVAASPINRKELGRARTTLLTRHESELKDNTYWLGLLTHCQEPSVPWKKASCLRDLIPLYQAITVEDLYYAYSQLALDDGSLFTCVGTSGKESVSPPEERLVGGIGTSQDSSWAPPPPPTSVTKTDAAQNLNPMAVLTAMTAAMQFMNLRKALDTPQDAPKQQ